MPLPLRTRPNLKDTHLKTAAEIRRQVGAYEVDYAIDDVLRSGERRGIDTLRQDGAGDEVSPIPADEVHVANRSAQPRKQRRRHCGRNMCVLFGFGCDAGEQKQQGPTGTFGSVPLEAKKIPKRLFAISLVRTLAQVDALRPSIRGVTEISV
jgi:hypothetical protein